MRRSIRTLTILIFCLIPGLSLAQDLQEVERSGEIYSPAETDPAADAEDPVERHMTPSLLESDEGQQAMRRYRELRDERYYERRIRPLQVYEEGDRRTFFVRDIEAGLDGSTEFDEIEFELARIGTDLETGGPVEIWVEVEELAEDRITQTLLDEVLEGMVDRTPSRSIAPDRGVVEIGRSLFGDQPNAGRPGVLKVLMADIRDGWDPDGENVFTAGFFDPVNLLPSDENEFSNEADIIYINTMPGIYRPGAGVLRTRLNTIAHELQHLIHATYDGLSIFQNEGQSELAEILSGFPARAMSFLNSGSETRGEVGGAARWIYRFRTNRGAEVLYDYQRAQLLHSYLEERVGPEEAGELTQFPRASRNNNLNSAYRWILDRQDITLEEFFTGFYVSAYANRDLPEESFGFSRNQLINVQVANPGMLYDAGTQPWILNRQEEVYFGGALYTQWFGIESLNLTMDDSGGLSHYLLFRERGESDFTRMDVTGRNLMLEADGEMFEEVVLVSVNASPTGSVPTADESRTFRYSADWEPTDLVTEELAWHGEVAVVSSLPWNEAGWFAYAKRISPDFDAQVRSVRFQIFEVENAIQGEGDIDLVLREARPAAGNPDILPGPSAGSLTLNVNDLSPGENFIGVPRNEWNLQEGEEYFISLEVVEDRGNLLVDLLFDDGTTDELDDPDADPAYTPPRTFAGTGEPGEITGWRTIGLQGDQDRPNLILGANLVGFRETGRPDYPEPPDSDEIELLANYPNPFTDQTTIEYSLPEPAEIEITVHDILGRQVDVLYNGEEQAGLHRMTFEAGALASGIYFYRLRYPDGVQTRRMTLLR